MLTSIALPMYTKLQLEDAENAEGVLLAGSPMSAAAAAARPRCCCAASAPA